MSDKKSIEKKSKNVGLSGEVKAKTSNVSLSEYSKSAPFSFNKENYKLLLIGLAINFLGYILMIGGANEDPNVFDGEMFSARRITIAPMLIVAGFAVIIYAIMKKPKAN